MNISKKYNLKTDQWFYYGQWEQPLFSASHWSFWYDKGIAKKIKIEKLNGGLIMINGHTIVYKKDLEILKSQLENACNKNDKSFFKRLNQVSLKILDKHLELIPSLENYKKFNLIELFNRFIDSNKLVMFPWCLNVFFSDDIGEILISKANEFNVVSSEIVKSIPNKETLMLKQYSEALMIKKMLQSKGLNNEALWKKIKNHVKEYEWVGTHHFWGEPLSVKKFLKDFENLKEIKQEKTTKILPKELKFLTKAAGDIGFLRQYSAEIFDLVAFKAKGFLKEVAKRLGLSYKELLLLTPTEVNTYLKKGTRPIKNNLAKRNKYFCTLLKANKEIIIDNAKEVEVLIKELIPQRNLSTKQFKGMVACEGNVRGIAKIFLVPEKLSKMKKGNILVTTMTTPDFIPLMQKASAIVTDIGGLLSHAAIVSREMKKPCIIGTEIATKVLKDGDEIEVDAIEGVVKILKK